MAAGRTLAVVPESDHSWGGNGSTASHVGEHAENGAASHVGSTGTVAAHASSAAAVAEPAVAEAPPVAAQPAAVATTKASGSLYGDAVKPPQAADLVLAVASHLSHGLRGLAAEQDAVGPDRLGRDHRRGGGDRHDGDRPRLEDGHRRRRSPAWAPTTCMFMPGAATSGGVSFGSGTAPRSRPATARRSASSARPWPTWPRSCSPEASSSTATITGTRGSSSARRPSYLEVRDWDDLEEGDIFTDRDVRNANKVCLIGTTLEARAFRGRIARRQGDADSNVSFRVIGVLSSKGANMMGMDQDDIVLAPWTTIKYPRQRRLDQRRAKRIGSVRQRGLRGCQQPQQPLSDGDAAL